MYFAMERFLSVILLLSLSTLSVYGENLCFNTSHSESKQSFFVNTGDAVVLTCNPPGGAKNVKIMKGQHPHTQLLLQGGNLKANDERFEVLSSKEEYKLFIPNLNKSDSAIYKCSWEFPWYSPIKWWFWNNELQARLQVVNRQMNECVLLNGFDGIFFAGENFDLYCPKDIAIDIFIAKENENIPVQPKCIDTNESLVLRRIHNVSTLYNNSRLVCNKNGSDNDYCISTPNITVYEDLQVTVEPQTVNITEGGNLSLTCSSFPRIQASIEWDLSGSRNIISNANFSHSSNGYGSIVLTMSFQNETKVADQYSIKCRVIAGSKNITKMVTIHRTIEEEYRKILTVIIPFILTLVVIFGVIYVILHSKRLTCDAEIEDIDGIDGRIYETIEMQVSENDSVLVNNLLYETQS